MLNDDIKHQLPEFCAATNPSTGEPILIKRGERGYWPWYGDPDAFNTKRGISKGQCEAMLVGSMFGWNVPGVALALLENTKEP
jgi:hypothetical protein